MLKGIRRRRYEERMDALMRLIRRNENNIKTAECEGDEKALKKFKRHQYWLFRYAKAIGWRKFQVKVVGKFEYTATVCARDDYQAMNEAQSAPSELCKSLSRIQTSAKRIKELDFDTDEVMSDEKIRW